MFEYKLFEPWWKWQNGLEQQAVYEDWQILVLSSQIQSTL